MRGLSLRSHGRFNEREIRLMGNIFQPLSEYSLGVFAKSTDTIISELAKNELTVRKIRGRK